ncbi:hypothetical protein BRW65_27755 [Mycobacterium paraffinicum]|uniref:Uncharacterized protein n=1 Tax=Mycobacterium paraffinicum TaxID=53378 RepID=A0A1Q4HEA3_9MYCO|nr:hypothetical protein [Mycobacterium paraffinicum]OJZ65815.1 hypothetical protein BRW65_27755 [Mycobacterium paraffinicum]
MNAHKTLSPGVIAVIDGVPVSPIFGGTQPTHQYGINVAGDVLVNQLADGSDLNAVYTEYANVLNIWNNERTSLTDLLKSNVTVSGEAVPQDMQTASFEDATELGISKSASSPTALPLGYTFRDKDLRGSFSWRFLRDADRRQVDSVMDGILAADNKLVTGTILRALFSNTRKRNEHGMTVYDLYDGVAPGPPSYLGRTFDESTSHYIASGASQIDSQDIEDAIRLITRKGYGTQANSKLLILANPDESELIQTWRAGEESRPKEGSETSGPIALHDFVPANDAPPFITGAGELVGTQVPGQLWGVKVEGSYGPALLVQSDFLPSGYVAVVASYGPNSAYNCIGFRQHSNPAYQGLRHIPGAGAYPIVESFHTRAFGVGVRQRGAAVCVQVTTGNTYTAPSADQIPV